MGAVPTLAEQAATKAATRVVSTRNVRIVRIVAVRLSSAYRPHDEESRLAQSWRRLAMKAADFTARPSPSLIGAEQAESVHM